MSKFFHMLRVATGHSRQACTTTWATAALTAFGISWKSNRPTLQIGASRKASSAHAMAQPRSP
eukprot:5928566-Amphidinium_carterae.1